MSDFEDEFSPPLEAALRRSDSNRSWTPGSQGAQGGSQGDFEAWYKYNQLNG
jgi:hypothetical protein